jgi:hypothetical protein
MIRRLACFLLACGMAAPLGAQRLFRDSTALEVTIVTDLRALIRERDSTRLRPHTATVTYREPGGATKSLPARLRARGHFRRQARNCGFPPIRVDFAKADVQGTVFQGNDQLKLTTNCRPGNADYEQYILAEYALYRGYQAVSPKHFRTRLARVIYRDSAGAAPDVQSWAFFIEADNEVAKEHRTKLVPTRGALFADLHQEQLAITSLYEYMIANTDWSISGLHNVSLMRDSIGAIHPVAFDFDWSGAVNARYSFPDARLGIRTVTERLYRGPCLTVADWEPVFARFTAARPRIESVYASLAELTPQRKRAALEFFEEFYRIIRDPRRVKSSLIDSCQPRGN